MAWTPGPPGRYAHFVAFRVTVPASREEDATVILSDLGTAGMEMQPAAPGEACFLAYFPAAADRKARLAAAMGSIAGAQVSPAPIPDVDWVARFREGFQPFHAAGFEIVPEWRASEARAAAAALRIVVDPGQAFGTGTHETTRLCLQALRNLAGR